MPNDILQGFHRDHVNDQNLLSNQDGPQPANAEGNFSRGRLKICSKSVVFVPQADPGQSNLEPLLKFPLTDCTEIIGKS